MTVMRGIAEIDLYPVTGRGLFENRTDTEVIAQLAAGGAKIVQLREKYLIDRELYELARLYRRETDRHGMMFILNDRPDIAKIVGADGVHLGHDDLPISAVREIMGPDAIIGASSSSLTQAMEAQKEGASYVNIGPIFKTPTKPDAKAIGLEPLRLAVDYLDVPVTVMGGITDKNIKMVVDAGARHIGVVTAIFGDRDIEKAVKRLVGLMYSK